MSSATRAIVLCAFGAFTVACTAISGADDLATEEHGQAVGQAEPEQRGSRIGRPAGTDGGSSGSSPNDKNPPTPTPNPSIPPPPPPPPPAADAGPQVTTSIGCGAQTCAGATPNCCAAVGSYTCVAAGTQCVGGRYRLTCDSTQDCGNGEVCCAYFGGPNEGSRCTAAANCKVPQQTYARMCTSNNQCAVNQSCAGYILDADGLRLDLPAGLCIPN